MSTLKADSIENGGAAVNFPADLAIGDGKVTREYYAQSGEPSGAGNGAVWWDTGNSVYKLLIEGAWYTVGLSTASIPAGDRAIVASGYDGSAYFQADYFSISTPGNASSFGNLSVDRQGSAAASDATIGLFGGGGLTNGLGVLTIDYFTFSTTGNAVDFGDLTVHTTTYNAGIMGAVSDFTTALFAGGGTTAAFGAYTTNAIEYVTFATPGNGTDFGDLTVSRDGLGGVTDGTYGVFGGGNTPGPTYSNVMDYVTIATPGNATDFGDLTLARGFRGPAGAGDGTLGLFASGRISGNYSNVIDYITIATPGNATDFGDLTVGRYTGSGTSDLTTAVFSGGYSGTSTRVNVIDYVTIATPGNATDFGDLTGNAGDTASCSGD